MENRGKLTDSDLENAAGGKIELKKEQEIKLHAMSAMGPFCLCCGEKMMPVAGGYKCFKTGFCREAGKLKSADEVKWK